MNRLLVFLSLVATFGCGEVDAPPPKRSAEPPPPAAPKTGVVLLRAETRIPEKNHNAPGPGQNITLSGYGEDGKPIVWQSYRGRIVYVVVWSTRSQESLVALQGANSVYKKFHDSGVDVIGICNDDAPLVALATLQKMKIPWKNLIDASGNSPLLYKLGITALPASVLIDRKGQVVVSNVFDRVLDGEIEKLLDEDAKGNLKAAEVGVGKKGQGYGGGILTEPIRAKFRADQMIVFEVQIPNAMKLFEATNGRKPKNHAEFMKAIVGENQIKLPELPEGEVYAYVPESGKLMVASAK